MHSVDVLTRDKEFHVYGVYTKTHIWRATRKLSRWRFRLSQAIQENNTLEYAQVVKNLFNLGIVSSTDLSVLQVFNSLTLSNYFSRILKYLVSQRTGLTIQTAAQLVNHRRVRLDGFVINLPYFVVSRTLEETLAITLPLADTGSHE